MYNRPLHGGEVIVVHRHVLLTAPSEAAVVDDDVLSVFDTDASAVDELVIVGLAQSSADIADNQVIAAAQIQLGTAIEDAVAGSRLSGNGDVCQLGADIALQLDDTTHAEHDGGVLLSGLGQRPAQRAFAAVVQIGYLDHLSAASARCQFAETACRGEGQQSAFLCCVVFDGRHNAVDGNHLLGIVVGGVAGAFLEGLVNGCPVHVGGIVGFVYLSSPADAVAGVDEVSTAVNALIFSEI